MSEENFQEKTEDATPKKQEESRKEGKVAKSKELSSIAILSAGTLYLFFGAKELTFKLGENIRHAFAGIPQMDFNNEGIFVYFFQSVERFMLIILPLLLVLMCVALLANFLQTGILWSVDPLTPKASKIDPIKGAGKIFSKRTLVELAKSIFKIAIVGWAAFSTLKSDVTHLVPLMTQGKIEIIYMLGQISLKLVIRCSAVIMILAILDYMYQRWEHEQSLKMTKQEVKDEFKQTEGDPIIKSRIKAIQRDMARRRMMEEVPKADVVITNPTHLSIAIRYESGENMSAPRIVAKGANKIAFRIRELAAKSNIPLVENKTLAQNLYKLELGEEIPPKFYQAVAEILAYVYGLKKKKA